MRRRSPSRSESVKTAHLLECIFSARTQCARVYSTIGLRQLHLFSGQISLSAFAGKVFERRGHSESHLRVSHLCTGHFFLTLFSNTWKSEMFLNHTAHTGSCSQAWYQLPTGYESNVELVLLGNADNSLSIGGDEEDEDLQDAQLVQGLPWAGECKAVQLCKQFKEQLNWLQKGTIRILFKFYWIWFRTSLVIGWIKDTKPHTSNGNNSKLWLGRAKSGRHCCLSGHESHSFADDLRIQKHWEKRRGELQSTARRLVVRTQFRIRSGTGSTTTLLCARSYGRDDTERRQAHEVNKYSSSLEMKFNIIIFVLKDKPKNLNHTQWNWDRIWTYHTQITLDSKASTENYEIRVATWMDTRNCTATKSQPSMATQFFVAEGEDQRSRWEVSTYNNEVAPFTSHDLFRNTSESTESRKTVGYRNNYTRWNLTRSS